jgi:copper chaperone CopZ
MENEKESNNKSLSGSIIEEVFLVEGMTCGSCAKGVQRSLTKLEGVKSAEVSLAGSSATVAYDPGEVTPDQMQQAVESSGYRFGKREGRESR